MADGFYTSGRPAASPEHPRLIESGAMPFSTVLVVAGSWILLAGLAMIAWRFNRPRGDD